MKLFTILLFTFSLMTLSAQEINLAEWQEKWDNSKAFTLELLKSIPEDSLGFSPTPDQMTIREQFQHMAGNMYSLTSRFIGYQPEGFDRKAISTRLGQSDMDTETLAEELTAAYAFASAGLKAVTTAGWGEQVDFFAGPKTRRQIAWLLQDHATHHRGQIIVYARHFGVKPPRYRGW